MKIGWKEFSNLLKQTGGQYGCECTDELRKTKWIVCFSLQQGSGYRNSYNQRGNSSKILSAQQTKDPENCFQKFAWSEITSDLIAKISSQTGTRGLQNSKCKYLFKERGKLILLSKC